MTKSLWVFGYGSLLWNPGFEFSASKPGVLKGFSRRFFQGNITHRGTPGNPGRVATLIEDNNEEVWGMAFEVISPSALPYLNNRECKLGGYISVFTKFYPSTGEKPYLVLVYMATKNNTLWLGDASDEVIADQIVRASGPKGHNVEYLLRLAEFQRTHAPGLDDPHLFNLEALARKQIKEDGLNLAMLMGPPIPDPKPTPVTRIEEEIHIHRKYERNIQETTLRCLSI